MIRNKQLIVLILLMIAVLVAATACDDVTNVVQQAQSTGEAVVAEQLTAVPEAIEAAVEEPEEAAEAENEEGEQSIYEGETGPDHWAELYPNCAGLEQSPIDVTATLGSDLQDIVFNYAQSAVKIFNNGHTIQVVYDPGSSITITDTVYPLAQFHFHSPSEHKVNGVPAAAELHLVHAFKVDDKVTRAVVGVLIQEGAENPAFASVWANLPTVVSEEKDAQTIEGAFVNADDLLPDIRTYFTYPGSLTTPPCDEDVTWLLLTTPIEMSAQQIADFRAIIEPNNRPVQPLNDRQVLEDTNGN